MSDLEAQIRKRPSWKRTAQSNQQRYDNTILVHSSESGDPYYIGTAYHRYDHHRKRRPPIPAREKLQTVFEEKSVPPWFGTPPPEPEGPYLTYLKRLRYAWPNIGYLAEWMDVTTAPPKLMYLQQSDQLERARRTKAAVIEYDASGRRTTTSCTDIESLRTRLDPAKASKLDKDSLQIVLVEDLSRDVIETLGSRFDVDPHFFTGQVADYKWFNTRDPWFEAQHLHYVSKDRPFLMIEYVQPWYFPDRASYKDARKELGLFNVLRRDESDGANSRDLDVPGSEVGLIRTKMSLWIRPNKDNESGTVGILVVDPTIKSGWPLWGGYLDFSSVPSMDSLSEALPAGPTNTFADILRRLDKLDAADLTAIRSDPKVLLRLPLMRVASEWHMTVQFARCRLAHVEWEIERPEFLSQNTEGSEGSQKKLNPWRRRLPFLRRMVIRVISQISTDDYPFRLQAAASPTSTISQAPLQPSSQPSQSPHSLDPLLPDFHRLLSDLDDLISHADKILSVAIAMVSIDESRKAIQQNRNVTRLTYIALVFVPLSFVASLFSMTTDLSAMGRTFWIYASVAVPVAGALLVAARWWDRVAEKGQMGTPPPPSPAQTRPQRKMRDDQADEKHVGENIAAFRAVSRFIGMARSNHTDGNGGGDGVGVSEDDAVGARLGAADREEGKMHVNLRRDGWADLREQD